MDIGACEGAFSAEAAAKGATVVLVEPSVIMQNLIIQLFKIRNLPEPKIIQCLLGKESGEAWFIDNQLNPGASRVVLSDEEGAYRVPVMTLDELVQEHLPNGFTFLKCDAEGWDYEIIASGPHTLKKWEPKIAITTYHAANHFEEISNFLKSLGYTIRGKGLLLAGDRFRPLMLHATPSVSSKK